MLKIDHLEVGYGESMILRNVSLQVNTGQVVCLMGRNGVGKTTLMRASMGLLKPRSGTIRHDDRDITAAPPEHRAHAGIGYVPQGRDIFPQLSVEENLQLGLEASRRRSGAGGRNKTVPESVYEMFPVLKEMKSRKGGDLSGGQQQQLSIARALVSEPKLLLLDEPMEGIQPNIVMLIEHVIGQLKQRKDMAILLVEQSLSFATSIADQYYVLDKGTVVAEGSPSSLSEEQVRKHLIV